MKKTVSFLLLSTILLTAAVFAESFTGKAVSVTDGNNIVVIRESSQAQVKFDGVDCPDLDQPYGPQAREFVSELLLGHDAWVDVKWLDHSNRLVSLVQIDGKNAALEIIKAGFGWFDSRHSQDAQLAQAERDARASKKIGICFSASHQFYQKRTLLTRILYTFFQLSGIFCLYREALHVTCERNSSHCSES